MAVNHEERAARAWPILTEVARKRTSITYGNLGKAIGIHQRPVRYVLGLIQDYCLSEKLPPLTILVVEAATGRPSAGFIAWDTDSLGDGRQKVFELSWQTLPNPFAYALSGITREELSIELLENPEVAEDVYRRIKVRGLAQQVFRTALLEAYNGACAFCGLSFEPALDAAHIYPWAQCSSADRLNVRNGLLLCAVHHRMFDEDYFEITADHQIEYVDPDLTLHAPYGAVDRAMSADLHLKKLHLPDEEDWLP
jgi:putative restriction endonuclease